jgi:hypothetical protein
MDNIYSAAEVISALFEKIDPEKLQNVNVLLSAWKKVLFSMDERKEQRDGEKSYNGENLYYHSKIVDIKNGILMIEVDHPGWIQLFQISQKYILNGLKKNAPKMQISVLSFRLQGENAELSTIKNAVKAKNNRKKDAESHEKEQISSKVKISKENSAENTDIPEPLREIFVKMKNNILTREKDL